MLLVLLISPLDRRPAARRRPVRRRSSRRCRARCRRRGGRVRRHRAAGAALATRAARRTGRRLGPSQNRSRRAGRRRLDHLGAEPPPSGGRSCPSSPARRAGAEVATLSTESIASPSPRPAALPLGCAAAAPPLAADQRYCLECGERRAARRASVLGRSGDRHAGSGAGSPCRSGAPPAAHRAPAGPCPRRARRCETRARNTALTLLAGVGVLLLAMGVGVLIGRSGGSSKPGRRAGPGHHRRPAPAHGGAGRRSETFTATGRAGTNGYTVQLQTLPDRARASSAVEAAKIAAATARARRASAR